jgi:DNA-binding response OmpR family regulator
MENEKTRKILVVDDEPFITDIVQKILVTQGYEVVTASDGKEAFDVFEENQFDLVLMDMMMPAWNGNKTFHEMRRIAPDVKILFMTGFDKTETLPELLKMGAIGCLSKPFNMENLIDKVKSAVT